MPAHETTTRGEPIRRFDPAGLTFLGNVLRRGVFVRLYVTTPPRVVLAEAV